MWNLKLFKILRKNIAILFGAQAPNTMRVLSFLYVGWETKYVM